MAHAQKPDLVSKRHGLVHLNWRGSQFSGLLAVEECGSAGRPWIDNVPRYIARVVATLSADIPVMDTTLIATYADDTAILASHVDPVQAAELLQQHLRLLETWMKRL
jgi:hypothetical protein